MRDSTFTLQALHWLNLDWEADEFMQFVADLEPNDDGSLQIMYGIDGRRDLTESTRDDLSGYAGARPVRIGNGAYDQRQNDVFGAVLGSILLHTRRSQRLAAAPLADRAVAGGVRHAVWREPDQGIWEARGAPQHYVSSKLMCWVAMDRAAKLAEIRGDPALLEKWHATADEIRDDILEHGVTEKGVLRQHYDTDALDASNLLAAHLRLPARGPTNGCATSVLAIADELTENGFVLRYRTEETDDGLSGEEGTFLICSFWLVSALADHRRGAARAGPDGAAAPRRVATRAVRRRVRRRDRPPPRKLPAGVLAPGPHRGGCTHHRSPSAWRSSHELVRRHHHRHAAPAVERSRATSRRRARASSSSSAATGCRASRRTGWPQDVFVDNRYVSPGHLVRRARASRSSRRSTTSSAARRSSTAPRCTACARRTSASCGTTTASRPRGRSRYDEMEPYYTQAEQMYQVHGSARRRPDRAARQRAVPASRRVSHEPRIQQLSDDLARGRLSSVPRALRHHAQRGRTCRTARASAARPAMASPASFRPSPTPRSLGVRPALEHANVTLLTNAHGRRSWRRTPPGSAVTDVVVERTGATETLSRRHRRRVLRRGELRQAAAGVGERQAPERARERLRPGGAQLHVPQQPGRAGPLARNRTRRSTRRRWA